MKKYIIVLLTTLIVTGCSNNKKVEINDLQQFSSNNKIYTIKKGEELSLNAWNELDIYYSGKNKINKKKSPVIYKGVTLGTDYKDVLEIFNIKPEYAFIDMEVSNPEEDGTTNIKTEIYKDEKVFEREYLDLSITFGYIKKDDKWEIVKYDELEKYIEEKKEDILVYYIDFNGLTDECVDIGKVISFNITYK